MNKDLIEELEYMINILTQSGFYSNKEVLEILKNEFIDENINWNKIKIPYLDFENSNFSILEKCFHDLSKKDIIAIHNCGYDINEGVNDAWELFTHLKNNNLNPIGFCFYTFEDIEEAIHSKNLKLTFGDFENNENKALKIGNIISNTLKEHNLNIIWDGTINNHIEINPFEWDKKYDHKKDYEIEGALQIFNKFH